MNTWYFLFGITCLLLFLTVGLLICIILFVKHRIKKQNSKVIIASTPVDAILLLMTILYASSHSTYYKYNDWTILQNNVNMVEQKYGEFDLGEVRYGEKGKIAYYIYTDNGPIMPDHLKHYYYMEYDEKGIIYHVYDGCQPGG